MFTLCRSQNKSVSMIDKYPNDKLQRVHFTPTWRTSAKKHYFRGLHLIIYKIIQIHYTYQSTISRDTSKVSMHEVQCEMQNAMCSIKHDRRRLCQLISCSRSVRTYHCGKCWTTLSEHILGDVLSLISRSISQSDREQLQMSVSS